MNNSIFTWLVAFAIFFVLCVVIDIVKTNIRRKKDRGFLIETISVYNDVVEKIKATLAGATNGKIPLPAVEQDLQVLLDKLYELKNDLEVYDFEPEIASEYDHIIDVVNEKIENSIGDIASLLDMEGWV